MGVDHHSMSLDITHRHVKPGDMFSRGDDVFVVIATRCLAKHEHPDYDKFVYITRLIVDRNANVLVPSEHSYIRPKSRPEELFLADSLSPTWTKLA